MALHHRLSFLPAATDTSAGSAHSQSSDLLTSSFTLVTAVLLPFSLETFVMDLNNSFPSLALGACLAYR